MWLKIEDFSIILEGFLITVSSQYLLQGNKCSDYHHPLALIILELHVNVIIQYIHFTIYLLSLIMCFEIHKCY